MSRFNKLLGVSTVLSLAAVCGTVAADDEKSKPVLNGGYTVVKGERDGEPIPEEHFKGSIIRFTKDEVVGTDKDTPYAVGGIVLARSCGGG